MGQRRIRVDGVVTIERPLPYPDTMPSEHLTQQLLALPLPERVALAETLWQSIDEEPESDVLDEEREAVEQARKRSEELDPGAAAARTHEQVMEAARRALQCD